MGEEEKKSEENKMEEKKTQEAKKPEDEKKEEPKAEKPSDDKKEEAKESKDAAPAPPPPQEIVLRVYMHCEGCARKVRRCLKGFEGVEDVQTDCKTQKVVVKGEKADPIKVRERVQRKSHRQVELLSPIPKPPAEEPKKAEEKEAAKPEEKKSEPQVITVVLKAHMHCEACAQEIKKRIQRMKGVESVDPDLKSSHVTVKGVFEPQQLVDYVCKRTGKHAVIVKQEPEKKEEEKGKVEKKAEEAGDKGDQKVEEKKKEGGDGGEAASGEAKAEVKAADQEDAKVVELMKFDVTYPDFNRPQYFEVYHPHKLAAGEYYGYPPYPPYLPPAQMFSDENPNVYLPQAQMFSDENPNACSVM